MSVFQTLLNPGKFIKIRKSISLSSSACKCIFMRKRSDVANKFVSFDEVVTHRRAEARRSLVIQVNSAASFTELYGYCSKYASVNGVHHYKTSGGEHFMLIEFSTEENLKNVLQSCSTHQKDPDVMALESPFLWFRASEKKEKFNIPESIDLVTKDGEMEVNEDQLFEDLMSCKTVSEQIQMLYDRTTLNDLGVRLRYLVARQIECLFQSMYSNIAVHPFGSSVNGFGKLGCDLDLVLTNQLTDEMSDPSKRLVFQEKKCDDGARQLALVGEALERRAAGVSRVTRILHARVPIVKCAHSLAGLDVDLCYNHTSGLHMSRLLRTLGERRGARALGVLVRRWAAAAALTSAQPGRWLTNFPLTLLVLFFLQQRGLLPPVKTLVRKAGKEDVQIGENNLNYTFLRDLNKLPEGTYDRSDVDLETLLLQFFEFYAQFDFQDKAISIYEGAAIRKPNSLPMYIVNPLEPALNVSRNVSYEECERFRAEVRNAAWALDGGAAGGDWGVLALVERKASRGLKKLLRVAKAHRLVSVKDLFKEDDTDAEVRRKPKTEKVADASVAETNEAEKAKRQLKFKNNQVASEVYRIRRGKMV